MAPTRPPPKVQPWSTVPLQVIVNKRARDDRRADRVAREARNRRVTRLDDSGRLIHTRTSGVSAQQQNWTRHVQHLIHVAWAKLNNNGQLLPPDIAPPMGLFEYHDEEMRDELRDDLQDRQRKHLNAFIQEFVQIAAVRNQRNANRRRDTSIAISISIPYLAKIYATGKRHACACSNKRTRNVLGIDMKGM